MAITILDELHDIDSMIRDLDLKGMVIRQIIFDLEKMASANEQNIMRLLKDREELQDKLTSTEAPHDNGTGSGPTA